ncbi:MAG: cyclic pyranopterin monophosphate synthase MoaC [Anaerolineaceae bacterium]|jgi:cyclic pyranopterin phosphate synthase
MELTHLDSTGAAKMIDISKKSDTMRVAMASGIVSMRVDTMDKVFAGQIPKGDVIACARIAGIQAAKKADELIPLCHALPLSSISIEFVKKSATELKICAEASTFYRTGVEMEALTAVSVAALTIYDMCKAIDKDMQINAIQLDMKSGGKSGTYVRGGE